MRLVVGVMTCIGLAGAGLAWADPPASAAPAAANAPASAAPPPTASASAPVVVESTQEFSNLEKHFLAEGYKIEMHNGEKYFCRREEKLGTRLGGEKICGTAQQLQASERAAQAAYQQGQSHQNNPSGK